jgi:RHS repeat-associated protein
MYDQTQIFGGAGFGITTRGYTMHEHLEMFNLINMNGRLYDPVLGRMLSPDNYIQEPNNTQSYNRFSYCINNPLKNTDPSGNMFLTSFLTMNFEVTKFGIGSVVDLFKTVFVNGGLEFWNNQSSKAWQNFGNNFGSNLSGLDPVKSGTKINNALKIDWGMFESDEDLPWYKRVWQVGARFTPWEMPQSYIGNLNAHYNNMTDNIKSVNYFHGATVLDVKELDVPGKNTGNYIRMRNYKGISYNDRGELSYESSVLIHEYGHYLQGRTFGSLGYGIGAINSGLHPSESDADAWFEQDASQRGIDYFRGKVNNIESYGAGTNWPYGLPRSSRNYAWMTGVFVPSLWLTNYFLF